MGTQTPARLVGSPWMEWAYLALGERAIAGAAHNPTVQDSLRYCGLNTGDERPREPLTTISHIRMVRSQTSPQR